MPEHFFDVTLGNIITWALIAVGYYVAQVKQAQIFTDRLHVIEKWIDKHESESGDRDRAIRLLEISAARLAVIAENATRALVEITRKGNM